MPTTFTFGCTLLWVLLFICVSADLKITGTSLVVEEGHQLPVPQMGLSAWRAGHKCTIGQFKEPTTCLSYSCPCKFPYPGTVGALKASRGACMFWWVCFSFGNTRCSSEIADRQDIFKSVKCYLFICLFLFLSLPSSCWSVNTILALCGFWEYSVVLCDPQQTWCWRVRGKRILQDPKSTPRLY